MSIEGIYTSQYGLLLRAPRFMASVYYFVITSLG